jgi:hypothetical protein
MLMRLSVASHSLERTKAGTIFGVIYFETGNAQFPVKGWSDLAVAFSRAWVEALVRMASKSNKERVWFMDGPYAVDLSTGAAGKLNATFVHNGLKGESVVESAIGTIESLLDNATVGEDLLLTCNNEGWSDSDTTALMISTEQARKTLAQLGHKR